MGAIFDRVGMSLASAPGVGDAILGSALSEGRSWATAGATAGQLVNYVLESTINPGVWEIGEGTYRTGPARIERTTIVASSNGGTAVSFNSNARVYSDAFISNFLSPSAKGLQPSKGAIIGDSTIAPVFGMHGVDFYLLLSSDSLAGSTITNLAVPGQTIAEQQAVWTADTNKSTYDWIIVEIGLNDLDPAESAATALGRYQTLINTINSGKKSSAIVIVSTMTPCKSYLDSTYGAGSYQKWLDMNAAIMGGGANAITGVHYRVNNHTAALNDGAGNMSSFYDYGDRIHETNAGRSIIADVWRQILNSSGYLTATQPAIFDNNWANVGADLVYKCLGKIGIGIKTPIELLHIAAVNPWLLIENSSGLTNGQSGLYMLGDASTGGYIWTNGSAKSNFGGNSSLNFSTGPGAHAFFTNYASSPNFIITPSGRIGINTGSPAGTLDIGGNVVLEKDYADTLGLRRGNNPQWFSVYNTYTDVSNSESWFVGWDTNVCVIGTLAYGTGVVREISIAPGYVESMRFKTNGKIGIGTNSPLSMLDVVGTRNDGSNMVLCNKSAASSTGFDLHDNTNTWQAGVGWDNALHEFWLAGTNDMTFRDGPSWNPRLILKANGYAFLPNATVIPGSNPSGGGYLYIESGALKYRGSSGTVTTLAAA